VKCGGERKDEKDIMRRKYIIREMRNRKKWTQ
jgi:hypothetical protein